MIFFIFMKIKEHDNLLKTNEDLFKLLKNYVFIIENYSKTKKLNIESIQQNEEENIISMHEASNISENKQSLDSIKLNTYVSSLSFSRLDISFKFNVLIDVQLVIKVQTCIYLLTVIHVKSIFILIVFIHH
jgi:hypothetical protein